MLLFIWQDLSERLRFSCEYGSLKGTFEVRRGVRLQISPLSLGLFHLRTY
jgi:hypothetical protein